MAYRFALYKFCKSGLIFCLYLWVVQGHATHNRAGEISYVQLDDLTIRATITTWTKTSSSDVDRDSLEIFWGDGTSDWIPRINGTGEQLPNDIKKNLYTMDHRYPGGGTYVLSMLDPNRIGGILNVSFPNSVNVPFYIQTTLTLVNSQFQGPNSSPLLLQPPIDFGCVGQVFLHNPNAFDPDNDSISYELITPLQDSALEVPGYLLPDRIAAGPDNLLTMDKRTGTLRWASPQRAGEYNIAIAIHEWRRGIRINTTIRDMQIFVRDCENNPPSMDPIPDLCVLAGEKIEIEIVATDPDQGQLVEITALGGPFILSNSPAVFLPSGGFATPPVKATFSWQTTCDHVSDQYYTVIFKATDNILGETGLATLNIMRIKVIAPPPEDLQIKTEPSAFVLDWKSPYTCQEAKDYFRGFTIYRKINPSSINPDSCSPGLQNSNFQAIAFNVQRLKDGRYFYEDDKVLPGYNYCYRVVAEFAKASQGGALYNQVESLPSKELCSMLPRDHPIIINVDVLDTDTQDGRILIRWMKPRIGDLDTSVHRGPYMFKLYRSIAFDAPNFVEIPMASSTFEHLDEQVDTTFVDTELNTETTAYTYRVDFFTSASQQMPLNSSPFASSVFLSADALDRKILLHWRDQVPWYNYEYTIFRADASVDFDSLTTVTQTNHTDDQLENNKSYCYQIEARGGYLVPHIPYPLVNRSQIRCTMPIDTTAPCIPDIAVNNICDLPPSANAEPLTNYIEWTNPNRVCEDTDDAIRYYLYYKKSMSEQVELIATIDDINTLQFEHQPGPDLAGCYAISVEDRNGNISAPGSFLCVSTCLEYELPNTFTPNGDGANDYFEARKYRFVEHISIEIYDRWGGKVFRSNKPDFRWDGTDLSGKALPAGTYYYVLKITDTQPQAEERTGYVHLFR